jgi:hypothetical protein
MEEETFFTEKGEGIIRLGTQEEELPRRFDEVQ